MKRLFVAILVAIFLSGCNLILAQIDITSISPQSPVQAYSCSENGVNYIMMSKLDDPACVRKGAPLAVDVSGLWVYTDGSVVLVWLPVMIPLPDNAESQQADRPQM